MNYIKVEGHPNLVRDKNSGAILNINKTEIEANRIRKEREKQKNKEIEQLKNDVSEIKSMLNKLVEKL
jgi:hypothetical protein